MTPRRPTGDTARAATSSAAAVLGALAVAVALILAYARVEVLGPERFADRAADSVRTPAVRDLLAESITRDVIERARPDAIVARPVVESVVSTLIGSATFRPVIRAAAEEVYRALQEPGGGQVILGLTDAAVIAVEALRRFQPQIAAQIPEEAERSALELGERGLSARFVGSADALRRWALAAAALALALLVLAVAAAPAPRRGAERAGRALAAGGALVVAVPPLGGPLVAARVSDQRADAGRAVWEGFAGDLTPWGLVALGCGLAVWLAAAGMLRAGALARAGRDVARWASARPASRGQAALRGGALLAAGVSMAAAWRTVVEIAALALAVLVAVRGLGLLLDALAPAERRRPGASAGVPRPPLPAIVAGALAAVAVIAAGAFAVVDAGGPDAPAAGCNGSATLCDRPVNEVVFAATHNSMAAADEPGWFAAEQTGGIEEQLRFGVRGFLIDLWYGVPGPRGVATDFRRSGVDRRALVREYGESTIAAIERLRGRLGFGPRARASSIHLCHIACEAGATPIDAALRTYRRFLERNPGEVLVLVLQDEVEPEDTRREFVRAGLRPYLMAAVPEGEWPTLGEMVASGRRLIVMSENRGSPDIPWLLPAFEVMEETPYDVRRIEALRACPSNRGGTGKPLFQLNHWIDESVPSPATAARVNTRAFLTRRARRCAEERGSPPNLLAVNFYAEGDVLGAVRELNGVEG